MLSLLTIIVNGTREIRDEDGRFYPDVPSVQRLVQSRWRKAALKLPRLDQSGFGRFLYCYQPFAMPTANQARQVALPELALSEAEGRQAATVKNEEDLPTAGND